MLSRILRLMGAMAADAIAPRLCPCCGVELLAGERALCLDCLSRMPRTAAYGPASPLMQYVSNGIAPEGFTAAWFYYDAHTQWADMIRLAKYADRPSLARELGRQFARELLAAVPDIDRRVDLLLPVPMHWRKRLKRGYNQSVEIALGISSETGIPVGDNLVAERAHSTQTRKSATARRANMAGKLSLADASEIDGLSVAIVDDVVTTGATLAECVRAISVSGALPSAIGALSLGVTIK